MGKQVGRACVGVCVLRCRVFQLISDAEPQNGSMLEALNIFSSSRHFLPSCVSNIHSVIPSNSISAAASSLASCSSSIRFAIAVPRSTSRSDD